MPLDPDEFGVNLTFGITESSPRGDYGARASLRVVKLKHSTWVSLNYGSGDRLGQTTQLMRLKMTVDKMT